MQDSATRFIDYVKAQQAWMEQMDLKTIQQNIKNLYNPANFSHYLQALSHNGSGLHGVKPLFDPQYIQDQLMEILDSERFQALAAYLPRMPDNPKLEALLDLVTELAASNTKALTDAVILQSVTLRERIETAIDQAELLSGSHDLDEMLEAQQACWAETRRAVAEHFWMNAGLLATAVEANTHFLKSLYQLADNK